MDPNAQLCSTSRTPIWSMGGKLHRMKVLLVLGDSFNSQQVLWERVAERKIDLHVAFTLGNPRSAKVDRPAFGIAHELSCIRLRNDRLTWMAYRGLNRIIRKLKPDLVHVLNEPWSVVATQTVKMGAHGVVTHGCENQWRQGGQLEAHLRLHLARHNLARSDGFVSWNSRGVTWARNEGLRSSSPTLVLSAVLPDLEKFGRPELFRHAGRRRFDFGESFVVGFVGRMVPEKGIQWLLDSWRAAHLPEDAQLVFIGQGSMEMVIRTASIADSRVRFLGVISADDMPMFMGSIDAMVLPSLTTQNWSEQFGRVLTEAMASGTPVVASDSGAIPEVVRNGGSIVTEGSVTELSGALERLANDPLLRQKMGNNARVRAREAFSPVAGAEKLESFWGHVKESISR